VGTGFPEVDAAAAFARERRRESVALLTSRMTFKDRDAMASLPLDGVVAALGRVGERDVGLREIALDSIVGTSIATAASSTGDFGLVLTDSKSGGNGSLRRADAARRCPRSTSTASESCTSSRTATTAFL
jgi:hypothetical protein